MAALRWPLRLYLLAVMAAALIAVVGAGVAAPRVATPNGPVIYALLLAFAVFAQLRPIKISMKLRLGVDDVATFTSILLFGIFEAVLLCALAMLLAKIFAAAVLGYRASWYQHAFNVSTAVLGPAAGAVAYRALGGDGADVAGEPIAVVAAAAVLYLVRTGLVDLVIAIQLRRDPIAAWWGVHRRELGQSAALYLLGALAALSVATRPWAILLFVAPAALVYLSLRAFVRLREQTRAAIYELADLVDQRDPYTYGHSQRVASYARELARHMGRGEFDIDLITEAARMHDVGKISTPDHVLQKPGTLTPEEMAVMRAHAEQGAQILGRIPDFWEGASLVRLHHERHDGHGYPRALKGSEVPQEAAIIAVADAYDAMTTDRPYRKAMAWPQVRAELERGRGTQWDAAVVDAFLGLMEPRAAASRVEVAAAT